MREGLPPQRRSATPAGGGARGGKSNLSPKEGAEQAERKLGLPCFHAGQKVKGIYACVACQFRINNRGTLPTCPDCGEIIWAYMGGGERPVPEDEGAAPVPAQAPAAAAVVEEGVKLEAPGPVKVEENVRLEP